MRLFQGYLPSVFFLLIIIPAAVMAQGDVSFAAKPKKSLEKTMWLQYLPSTLLEPEVPITVTFLYKKNQRIGLAADAGFFIATQNYSGAGFFRYSGFRFKPEVKYYVEKQRDGPYGLYFSLQGLVKRTIKTNSEWSNQFDSSGQFQFSRLINYKERKLVLGLSIIFGGEVILDRKKRWLLDIYTGFGFRNKYFKAKNLPPGFTKDYTNRNFERTFDIYKNGTYMSFSSGIKIGYRVN